MKTRLIREKSKRKPRQPQIVEIVNTVDVEKMREKLRKEIYDELSKELEKEKNKF